jgi:hypothetical protein
MGKQIEARRRIMCQGGVRVISLRTGVALHGQPVLIRKPNIQFTAPLKNFLAVEPNFSGDSSLDGAHFNKRIKQAFSYECYDSDDLPMERKNLVEIV